MKISINFKPHDALGQWVDREAQRQWLKAALDAGTWSVTKNSDGVCLTLEKMSFTDMDATIALMAENMTPTPNDWRRQLAGELNTILKRARNSRGTHAKKWQD